MKCPECGQVDGLHTIRCTRVCAPTLPPVGEREWFEYRYKSAGSSEWGPWLRFGTRRGRDGEADRMHGMGLAVETRDPRPSPAPSGERDRLDAERYRALRRGLVLGIDEGGDIVIGASIAAGDEDGDGDELATERSTPFLSPAERASINSGAGFLRGDDVVDRAADFVRAELAAAPHPDGQGVGE